MGSTTLKGVKITWMDHATVKLENKHITYIDPFKDAIHTPAPQADLIIVTHPHFDHFDPEAINRLAIEPTVTIAKNGCDIGQLHCEARIIDPGDHEQAHGIKIRAVPAYNDHRFRNPGEPFHPRGEGMGVILETGDLKLYHAGDTDHIDEMADLAVENIDIAFLPIGGTYTMDLEEAVEAVKDIQPHIVVPIHYNMIEGTEADPYEFKRQVETATDTTARILQPET